MLARPIPLKCKGEIFDFGTHISAVWPLEGTGAKTGGIIVGAEDWRVYMFDRTVTHESQANALLAGWPTLTCSGSEFAPGDLRQRHVSWHSWP